MASEITLCTLALIPPSLRSILNVLKASAQLSIVLCSNVEEFVRSSNTKTFAVVLLPADGITTHEWWGVWGAVSSLSPRPSIVVYSSNGDSLVWAGVLAAGGFDVVSAPFTIEKMEYTLRCAAEAFQRKLNGQGS